MSGSRLPTPPTPPRGLSPDSFRWREHLKRGEGLGRDVIADPLPAKLKVHSWIDCTIGIQFTKPMALEVKDKIYNTYSGVYISLEIIWRIKASVVIAKSPALGPSTNYIILEIEVSKKSGDF